MRLPVIRGVIERGLLVSWRVDPTVVAKLLPRPFRPQVVNGVAIAGVCLIRLAKVRPRGLPAIVGIGSENAAHRVAVEWNDPATGDVRSGVYIPRRDSSSRLNAILGGRLVPGEHRHARFEVDDRDAGRMRVAFESDDRSGRVAVVGRVTGDWPSDSAFATAGDASRFFAGGSLGFSATRGGRTYDGLELKCVTWDARPFAIESAESSFFAHASRFPPGSATLDNALVMRDIEHEWHGLPPLECG